MKKRKDKAKTKQQFLEMKARQRKEFFQNLKMACDAFEYPDLYSKLTKTELEYMFNNKMSAPALVMSKDKQVPTEIYKRVKSFFPLFMKLVNVPLFVGRPPITLGVLFSEGLTLVSLMPKISENAFPGAKEAKQYFVEVFEKEHFIDVYYNAIDKFLYSTASVFSSIDKELIWMTYSVLSLKEKRIFKYQFELHYHVPKMIHVQLDGSFRPMYRVEWHSENEIMIAKVLPSQLGLATSIDIPMEVYAQSHVLRRFEERLGIAAGSMHAWMFYSFLDFSYVKVGENKFLIPYLLHTFKAGYLVASVVEGKMVIRTFLFLTNTGTPEYAKLEAITGLKQMDINYLAINTLNEIIASDLLENEKVRNIFIKAGCGSLIELIAAKDFLQDKTVHASAAHFLKYLDLEQDSDMSSEDLKEAATCS